MVDIRYVQQKTVKKIANLYIYYSEHKSSRIIIINNRNRYFYHVLMFVTQHRETDYDGCNSFVIAIKCLFLSYAVILTGSCMCKNTVIYSSIWRFDELKCRFYSIDLLVHFCCLVLTVSFVAKRYDGFIVQTNLSSLLTMAYFLTSTIPYNSMSMVNIHGIVIT